MALMTQKEVEHNMYRNGIDRAEGMMAKAEENGSAHRNPYSKEIFREYVKPLADAIRAEVAQRNAGCRRAHAALLDGLDADAVSFLAVRYVIGNLMGPDPDTHGKMAYGIGRTVHRELVLEQIAQHNPELYHTLARDLDRRLSKNERHRMTVFLMQAKKAGMDFVEWQIGSREQVGHYILGLLEASGLIDIGPERRLGYKRTGRDVTLAADVMDRIDQIKAYVAVTMPVYGPCVEPPLPWGFRQVGGYHTEPMRRVSGSLIHGSQMAREVSRETDMPIVYATANRLQNTAWKVNARILDAILAVGKEFSTKEIVSLADSPKPEKPSWLDKAATKETMTEEQAAEFKAWKRTVAEWHTERKLLGTRYGRFYAATRSAVAFRDYPALHFVYFADSRGRFYPLTYGMNPQGSDLSKALLHFAKGLPLTDAVATRWFHVQGANKWGFDKATLDERMSWVLERSDLIQSFAADPVANSGWTEAGDPLQFLAWCFEYADYCRDPANFVSHLPISMDGSCNGLQNLSAMFRDEVGGRATNLINNAVMSDIYADVAKAATVRLKAMVFAEPAEQAIRRMWLEHGISRSAVKRSVMTTPYGVTRRSAVDYVIDDYIRPGAGPTFDKDHYRAAAEVLMKAVWPAIGDVVVKGREAMDWLKKAAKPALSALPEDAEPVLLWTTPSGFVACQSYFESDVHRIMTRLHGPVKIKILSENDNPNLTRHTSGLAPNFVHSMDAAHLHLTTAAADRAGIEDLAMIHDDYGTHAANAQKLYELIREQFVVMYTEHDPVADFIKQHPAVPPPPSRGSLDITEVLHSEYFFS